MTCYRDRSFDSSLGHGFERQPFFLNLKERKKGPPSRVAVVEQENIGTVHAPKHIQAAGALCMDRVAVLWSVPTAHRPSRAHGPELLACLAPNDPPFVRRAILLANIPPDTSVQQLLDLVHTGALEHVKFVPSPSLDRDRDPDHPRGALLPARISAARFVAEPLVLRGHTLSCTWLPYKPLDPVLATAVERDRARRTLLLCAGDLGRSACPQSSCVRTSATSGGAAYAAAVDDPRAAPTRASAPTPPWRACTSCTARTDASSRGRAASGGRSGYTLSLKVPAYTYLPSSQSFERRTRSANAPIHTRHPDRPPQGTTLRDLCKRIYGGALEEVDLNGDGSAVRHILLPSRARARVLRGRQAARARRAGVCVGDRGGSAESGLSGEGVGEVGEGQAAHDVGYDHTRDVDWDVDVDSDSDLEYTRNANGEACATDVDSVTVADPDFDVADAVHSDANPEHPYTRVLRIDSTANDPLSRLQLRADFEVFGRVEWVWVDLRHAHRTTALLAFAHARAALRAHTHIATLHPAYGAARLAFAPDPCARVPVGDDGVERRRDWPVGRERGGRRVGEGVGKGGVRKTEEKEGLMKEGEEKEERVPVPRRAGWARSALLRLKYTAPEGETYTSTSTAPPQTYPVHTVGTPPQQSAIPFMMCPPPQYVRTAEARRLYRFGMGKRAGAGAAGALVDVVRRAEAEREGWRVGARRGRVGA
ncbi:hypothetical protein B0H13DRAFT_2267823 [Mycena leptocephala]|nr:hypothetical protein B0H13DRAFT_2267823 [Mycena leptocephala]